MSLKLFFNILFLSLLLLSLPFLVGGCKTDCKNNSHDGGGFTMVYQGIMPYKGRESLWFLKNRTDTVEFRGQGKEVFYTTYEYYDGTCSIEYRMLHHRVQFKSPDQKKIIVEYYRGSETSSISDRFDITVNSNKVIEMSYAPLFVTSTPTYILNGIGRTYETWVIGKFQDTVYYNVATYDSTIYKIVRLKSGNDIFEVLP